MQFLFIRARSIIMLLIPLAASFYRFPTNYFVLEMIKLITIFRTGSEGSLSNGGESPGRCV